MKHQKKVKYVKNGKRPSEPSPKKRIALLIPKFSSGGAERMASVISHILGEKHDVFIFVFDGRRIDYTYKGELIDLHIPPGGNSFSKAIRMVKRIMEVRKLKKQYNINVTISFLENANVVNLFSRCRDRIILTIHNYNSKRNYGFIYEAVYGFLMKKFYSRADSIIAVSRMIAKDLIENYQILEQKIEIIYNSIDTDKIISFAEEPIDEKLINQNFNEIYKHPVVINVGRLFPQKAQIQLIRAFTSVVREIPNARLVILGEGDLKDELINLAKGLKLDKNVTFAGFQSNPYPWIKKAGVFVISSIFEGFTVSILEAMCCGTPVISTDCRSGPREILSPETDMSNEASKTEYVHYGVLTPVCYSVRDAKNDPLTFEEESLAKGIIELLNDKQLRDFYSREGIKRALDYDVKKMRKLWEGIVK